ncbi:hypothetical protein Emag_002816 [Eimeria magna]
MEGEQIQDLQLDAVVGFSGISRKCIVMHPDNKRLIFALGYSVVVRDLTTGAETFLLSHDNCVTCIAMSKDGKYLASGQKTHAGFVADIILWDLDDSIELGRLRNRRETECVESNALMVFSFHKVSVEFLDFSCDGKFLASLGGEHCNTLVLWSVEERKALCGTSAALEQAKCLAFYNISPHMLVSGDVLEIALNRGAFTRSGPRRKQLNCGVTALTLMRGDLLVGTGDGEIHRLAIDTLNLMGFCQVLGGLTSLVPTPDSLMLWAATSTNALYRIDAQTLTPHLKHSGHVGSINQVTFPEGCSQILATCSTSDIRVWSAESCKELLRIQLHGLECLCVGFAPDGSSIVSGWNDGKIRSFTPETGKLIFCIDQAHKDGVTAVVVTTEGSRVASGGVSGQFRVWKLHKSSQELIASRKEHRGKICCLRLRQKSIHSASYCAEEVNILATGSDHKVHYFDAIDGTKIRELEAAEEGDINCVAFHPAFSLFCTGGDDRLLRLWGYESGDCVAQTRWHADVVRCTAFSPDGKLLVSGGNCGVLHFWRVPERLQCLASKDICQPATQQ